MQKVMVKFIKNIGKRMILPAVLLFGILVTFRAQTRSDKQVPKYDTIIRKHVVKTIIKPVVKQEIILPVPEFINQPYYYNKEENQLIKLGGAPTALKIY